MDSTINDNKDNKVILVIKTVPTTYTICLLFGSLETVSHYIGYTDLDLHYVVLANQLSIPLPQLSAGRHMPSQEDSNNRF